MFLLKSPLRQRKEEEEEEEFFNIYVGKRQEFADHDKVYTTDQQ